jgi:hypothetical protein
MPGSPALPSLALAAARACVAVWHPRMLLAGLLAAALVAAPLFAAAWWGWEDAVAAVRAAMEQWALVEAMLRWLEATGGAGLRTLVAPMLLVAAALPIVVVLVAAVVALVVAPVAARVAAEGLARRGGGAIEPARGLGAGALGARVLACTFVASGVLVLSMPLWLVPGAVLLVWPLAWGWMAARVLPHAVLARVATVAERRALLHRHRFGVGGIGCATGFAALAASLPWATGAVAIIFAPWLMLASVLLHTAVFAGAAAAFAQWLLPRLENEHRPVLLETPR